MQHFDFPQDHHPSSDADQVLHQNADRLLDTAQRAQCETWSRMASQLAQQDYYADALEYYEKILAVTPDAIEAKVSQAVMLILLERPEEALQCCDRALSLNPDYARAWVFRGVALHRLNRYRESYVCYQRALAEVPSAPLQNTSWWQRWWDKVLKGLFS